MYRTRPNFDSQNLLRDLSPRSYTHFNPESPTLGLGLEVKDTALKHTIEKLIKQNQILHDNYNKEREKNYQLLELKRRLQEDIERIEFQLERIGTYQNLNNKEGEIKKHQLMQDNIKLKVQLDQYFQENKSMRGEIRKYMNQCQSLVREKDNLVYQNVTLLNQIADMKQKLALKQDQIKEYESELNKQQKKSHREPSIHDIVTIRSLNEKSHHTHPSKEQINSYAFQSPQSPNSESLTNHYGRNAKLMLKQELSTNPSEQKISLSSPVNREHWGKLGVQKIYEDFYEDNVEPSPRSFNNQFIHQKLEFLSPMRQQISSVNSKLRQFKSQNADIKSPSVVSYANRQSPFIVESLKLEQNRPEQKSDHVTLETYQKKSLKGEVSSLRNEIIEELITKYYKNALQCAQKQRKNSLRLFIQDLEPKVETFDHMVMNYLQVRSMLAQSCPTLRLKWEPKNPLSNSSLLQMEKSDPDTKSQLVLKNTVNLSRIYDSIKQKSRTQKTVAGQFLALFRLLTLLNKIEEEIDPLLVDCIKHSALKQIHRIKNVRDGKPFSLQE